MGRIRYLCAVSFPGERHTTGMAGDRKNADLRSDPGVAGLYKEWKEYPGYLEKC